MRVPAATWPKTKSETTVAAPIATIVSQPLNCGERRPPAAMIKKASSGSAGMIHACAAIYRIPPRGPLGHFVPGPLRSPLRFTALPAQTAGSVDLDGLSKAIAGQDDGQSNGGLGGRDGDNED